MKNILERTIGALLILAAIAAMLVSLFSLYGIWTNLETFKQDLLASTQTLEETITATDNLLSVINDSLKQAQTDLNLIELTMEDVALMLDNTADATQSVADLIGDDMTDVIDETQLALESTASSARLVDDVLNLMANIPLLGVRYSPEVPLQTSVTRVSESLDPVPQSLAQVQRDLSTTADNFSVLKGDITALNKTISGIKTNLDEARDVTENYQQILNQLDEDFQLLKRNLPGWVDLGAWALTGLLVWLVITQIAMMVQGLEMIARSRQAAEVEQKQE